ncbi:MULTISPECIES: hypothetical protein [Streptomyces]|uniref:Integral membrane protein n=1 Tax=Streptomyces clavifer TaxID=68188 RepID=A0ABS4V661_9ACTN|nr:MULTISPECIES: hypothetical protein [Streptomyces]KQX81287.1 hypothetical protein ASD26_06340 [Streptomyces sp. Root1319]KQZ06730.1 hypothetical protein ASD51_10675 [Streptomyces sp. Root55]MBP2359303.1 hypothetical protein [Streptomyces clavifer]MDX2744792.1 hypothetical protein [Streptomyces sp. NRRL_B-2557]RPK80975.1 hypothetical protein EES45_12480 [Streptomyces sp. ADI97-07]
MNAVSALAAIALPPLVLAVFVLSVWKTARGLPTRRWRSPGWWAYPAVVLIGLGCVAWFIGTFSGGLDVREACAAAGAPYDDAYRTEHWREPSQWFPLRNKCNAGHDLVPAWVNPSLVVFAVMLVGCAAGAVATAVIGRKQSEKQD